MGAFRIISFEVGVFHWIVSSPTISFSITWKLTLLLMCLLSTTKTSTSTKKPYSIMSTTSCNQVMQHGSDLIGIIFFLLLHHDPNLIMFTKILKDKYDHSIADQTEVDALLFYDGTKDKFVLTALKDLKYAFAQSVVKHQFISKLLLLRVMDYHFSRLFLSSGWIHLARYTYSNHPMTLPKLSKLP
jgi:hypothetical protein